MKNETKNDDSCMSLFMRQIPVPYCLRDIDGNFRYVNEELAKLLGRPAADLIGSTGAGCLPEEFLDTIRSAEKLVVCTGQTEEREIPFPSLSGGYRHYTILFFPCRNSAGQIAFVGCSAREITRRVRAENLLMLQGERFRRLVENLGKEHVLFSITPDGILTYVGPGTDHFLNLPPEQCLHQSIFNLVAFEPQSAETARDELSRLLMGKRYAHDDLEYLHPDGSIRTMAVAAHPVIKENGRVVGVEGIAWDVSERKRMEEALRRSEEAARTVLNATSDLVLMFDRDGIILETNEAYAKRIGRKREDLQGRRLCDVLPPERLARRYADTRTALSDNSPVQGVYVWGDIWEEYTLYPLLNREGAPERFVFFAHDVTELKKRELELRKLRTAIEQANVAVIVVDGQGTVEFVNSQYLSMTGRTREEVMGRPFAVLRQWRLDKESRRSISAAIRKGLSWRGEIHYRRSSGADFWADCSMTPVMRPSNGEVLHVIAAKNITERKRLEALQADAERIVRHNLKSPLNTISNVFYLMKSEKALSGDMSEYIRLGEDATRRMLRQIDMSLALFQMETGAYHFEGGSADVAEVIRHEIEAMQIQLNRRNIQARLLINGAADVGQSIDIAVDRQHFICLVDNLLDNALEASTAGDVIDVEITEEQTAEVPHVAIRFCNQAVVPLPIRNVFFEKYATYGKPSGSGLGTYSARLIAESMGGSITMASNEEEGTRVEVRFPTA